MRRSGTTIPAKTTRPATDVAPVPTLILNDEAARRWLVRVVAARAVQIYRERRERQGHRATRTDEGHNGPDESTKWSERPSRCDGPPGDV